MTRIALLAAISMLAACGGTTTVTSFSSSAPVPISGGTPLTSNDPVSIVGLEPDDVIVPLAPDEFNTPSADINSDFNTLINGARLASDVGPLSFDARLGSAAQDYAELMLERNHFGHIGPDGSVFTARVAATGYDFTSLRENIAAGQQSVGSVFTAWQGSDGHRENNLAGDVDDFGLGFAQEGSDTRWVLILGSED